MLPGFTSAFHSTKAFNSTRAYGDTCDTFSFSNPFVKKRFFDRIDNCFIDIKRQLENPSHLSHLAD